MINYWALSSYGRYTGARDSSSDDARANDHLEVACEQFVAAIDSQSSIAMSKVSFHRWDSDREQTRDLFVSGGSDGPPSWLLQSHFPGFPGEVVPGSETCALVEHGASHGPPLG